MRVISCRAAVSMSWLMGKHLAKHCQGCLLHLLPVVANRLTNTRLAAPVLSKCCMWMLVRGGWQGQNAVPWALSNFFQIPLQSLKGVYMCGRRSVTDNYRTRHITNN